MIDLRAARHELGISAPEAVRYTNERTGTNYPPVSLHQWEIGTRKPKAAIIVALAELYGLDVIDTLHAFGSVHPEITEAVKDPDTHRAVLAFVRERDAPAD
jgi:hypothetical protein